MFTLLVSLMVMFAGQAKLASWQWNSIGPDGGIVFYIAPNADGSSVLAVTPSSVWKYNGTTWNMVLNNVSLGPIYNTGQDTFCFVSTYYDSTIVYISTDGGNTWNRMHTFITGLNGYSNINGRYIYLASDLYLYLSSDGGMTWSALTPPYPEFAGADVFLTYSPSNPSTVFMLTYYDSANTRVAYLYKSTDMGHNWTMVSDTSILYGATSIAVDPDDTTKLAIDVGITGGDKQSFPGIYISEDGGQSWNYLLSSLSSGIIMASDLQFHNGNLYVASQITPGIFKGYEVSGIWFFTKLDSIHIVNDIASSGGTMFCGYSGGVLESGDWQSFSDITDGLKAVGVPLQDGYFGIYHSHVVNNTLYMIDNCFEVEHDGPIFSNVIYITRDGGNTWEKEFFSDLLMPVGIQTPINSDSIVYLSGIGYEFDATGNFRLHYIYRSNDGAQTFSASDQGVSLDSLFGVYDVEWISPSDPNKILAKFTSFDKNTFKISTKSVVGLLISTNGGQNFDAILPNVFPMRLSGGDTVVLSGFENWTVPLMEVSFDGGSTWSDSVIPVQPSNFISDVLFHANKLYFTSSDYVSNNLYTFCYDFTSGNLDTLWSANCQNVIDARLAYGNGKVFTDAITSDSLGQTHSSIVFSYRNDTLIADTVNFLFTAIDTLGEQLIGFTRNNSVYASTEGYVGIGENPVTSGYGRISIIYNADGPEFNVNLSGTYSLTIFDITGRKVLSGKFEARKLSLGGNLKPGVYFYKIEKGAYQTVGKFVIFR